jgi:Glyoxalase/Bleomycin resistance protein/Dioxygenase superfamily
MKMALTALPLIICLGLASSRSSDIERPALLGKSNGSFYALLVPQASEAAEWYRDYLGFSVIRSTAGPGGSSRTIMLEQQGVLLEIIEARGSFNLQSVTSKKISLLQGIRKVGIVIEDEEFDSLHSALVRKKATLIGDVFTDDGLKMRSFIVRDNGGNLVQFFSRIKS